MSGSAKSWRIPFAARSQWLESEAPADKIDDEAPRQPARGGGDDVRKQTTRRHRARRATRRAWTRHNSNFSRVTRCRRSYPRRGSRPCSRQTRRFTGRRSHPTKQERKHNQKQESETGDSAAREHAPSHLGPFAAASVYIRTDASCAHTRNSG